MDWKELSQIPVFSESQDVATAAQGETTIGEAVLTSDKLGAALRGTVIGARTVKIEPTGSDTYQVELAVSQTHVDRLIKAYRNGLL